MSHPFYELLSPLIGHRGASGHCPENTISSFKMAKLLGMSWIETDVLITADRVPVIFHDQTLERCTNAAGLILNTPYAQVQQLSAANGYGKEFEGERIPSLEQLISTCIELELSLILEIKSPVGVEWETVEAIAPVIRQNWPERKPLILSSFSGEALTAAKSLLPEFPRGMNFDVIPNNWREQLERYQCEGLHVNAAYIDAKKAKIIKDSGYKLLCFTVNDPYQGKMLLEKNIDALFTDYPSFLDAGAQDTNEMRI